MYVNALPITACDSTNRKALGQITCRVGRRFQHAGHTTSTIILLSSALFLLIFSPYGKADGCSSFLLDPSVILVYRLNPMICSRSLCIYIYKRLLIISYSLIVSIHSLDVVVLFLSLSVVMHIFSHSHFYSYFLTCTFARIFSSNN